MKFRSSLFLFALLLLWAGCGKKVTTEYLPAENNLEENGEQLFFATYAVYGEDAVYDEENPDEERVLSNIRYLLTENHLFAVGSSFMEQTVETADGFARQPVPSLCVFRIDLEQKRCKLLAEFSGETMLAMCEGENEELVLTTVKADAENYENGAEYSLRFLDADTGDSRAYILNSLFEGIPAMGWFSAIACHGNEIAIADTIANTLFVVDYELFEIKQTVPLKECTVNYLGYDADGKLYVVQADNNGTLYTLAESATALTELARELTVGAENTVSPINAYGLDGGTLYIATQTTVSSYNIPNKETAKVFDCSAYNIWTEGTMQIVRQNGDDGGGFRILTTDRVTNAAEVCTLSATAADGSLPQEKEIITFSNYWATPDMQAVAVAFNKSSDKYRVEIETAPDTMSYEEYLQNRALEITAGRGPDVFRANDSEFHNYVDAGYLVDVMPYMQRDLQTENYIENILYGEERDGKVYAPVISFSVTTAAGAKSVVGERDGWTFDEMCEVMEAHPEIEALFPGVDALGTLQYCYLQGGVRTDDYETLRECILFAEKYGVYISYEDAVLGENVLLEDQYLLGPRNVQYLLEAGDKYSLVGYPNTDKNGIFLSSSTWNINANSDNIEGAWEFLKFMLEDYQYKFQDMPVLREAYDARITEAMTPNTYTEYNDATGEEVVVEEPYNIWNGVPLYAMTEEQVKAYDELIAACDARYSDFDWAAWNIISEEADVYFAGDKSLDEVMETIEGRMDIYLMEKE